MKTLHRKISNPEEQFTMVPNRIFSLGFPPDALCLYIWLLSRREGWICRDDVMQQELGLCRNALARAAAVLKKRGVLSATPIKGEKGHFDNTLWTLYTLPEIKEEEPEETGEPLPVGTYGNTYHDNGFPNNGTTDNGAPDNRTPVNGYPDNRTPDNGVPDNRIPVNGYPDNRTTDNGSPDFSTHNNTIYNNTDYTNTECNKTEYNKTISEKLSDKSSSSSSESDNKTDNTCIIYISKSPCLPHREEEEEGYESLFSEKETGEAESFPATGEGKVLLMENPGVKVVQEDVAEAELSKGDTTGTSGGDGLPGMIHTLLREICTTSRREISLGQEKINTGKLREELSILTPEDIGPLADKVAVAMEKEEIRNLEAYLLKSLRNAATAKKFHLPAKTACAGAGRADVSRESGKYAAHQDADTPLTPQQEEECRRIREYYFSQCAPALKSEE